MLQVLVRNFPSLWMSCFWVQGFGFLALSVCFFLCFLVFFFFFPFSTQWFSSFTKWVLCKGVAALLIGSCFRDLSCATGKADFELVRFQSLEGTSSSTAGIYILFSHTLDFGASCVGLCVPRKNSFLEGNSSLYTWYSSSYVCMHIPIWPALHSEGKECKPCNFSRGISISILKCLSQAMGQYYLKCYVLRKSCAGVT